MRIEAHATMLTVIYQNQVQAFPTRVYLTAEEFGDGEALEKSYAWVFG